MVRDVSGNDVSQRTNGERVITRNARPRPRFVRKALEKRDSRQPDASEFLNQIRPRRIVCIRRLDSQILVKTGQRVLIFARKPKRAIEKYTLSVVYVVQDLANRPFSRLVRVEALFLRNTLEKLNYFVHLALKRGHDLVARYKVDIFEIVGCSFGSLWSCHLGWNRSKRLTILVTNHACQVSI